MPLNYQQIHEHIRQLGEKESARQQRLQGLGDKARALLASYARDLETLRQKVERAARQYDPSLRCALPVEGPLDGGFSLPALPGKATLLAADGSQILPDRHAEVEFGLINVGAVQIAYGSTAPPAVNVFSRLFYGDDLYTRTGALSEATIALRRDLGERKFLAELAAQATPPVITFTDGLLEIYAPRDLDSEEATEFQKSLSEYLESLASMQAIGVATAGYVDKPGTTLVVRLLEIALTPEVELADIKHLHPLRGLFDTDLYRDLLEVGDRSPVFAVQSPSARVYTAGLALHFFYINVGRPGHPWLARVEIPAWVAGDPQKLDSLHAVIVDQCQALGTRPYPYLLHRAHETALVSWQDKEQLTQMFLAELVARDGQVRERSGKQFAKDQPGRTRYK